MDFHVLPFVHNVTNGPAWSTVGTVHCALADDLRSFVSFILVVVPLQLIMSKHSTLFDIHRPSGEAWLW